MTSDSEIWEASFQDKKMNSFMSPRLSLCSPSLCRVETVAPWTCPDVDNGQFGKDARPTDGWDHLFRALHSQTCDHCSWKQRCTEQPWSVSPLEFRSSTSQLGDWSPRLPQPLPRQPSSVWFLKDFDQTSTTSTTQTSCNVLPLLITWYYQSLRMWRSKPAWGD